MATILFDGTSSQTASKATDTVILAANPALFTSAAELNGNVVLTFGSQTLTVTGTTLVANGLSNVTIPNGQLLYQNAGAAGGTVTGNTLGFLLTNAGAVTVGAGSTSSSVSALFGGLGRADSLDGAESIVIGAGAAAAKGSYLVYGNAGADSISSSNGFLDSNTATTVFGGRGVDTINLGTQGSATLTNTNFAIYGGEDGDSININHTGTGSLTIFGGTAAADSADGADSINLGTGTVGTINVYAAGGADIISSDGTATATSFATFASGATANFFGGDGNDSIIVGGGAKATITVAGGAGGDSLVVANVAGGSTTVYGGTGPADSADGSDNITVSGGGSFAVFGDAGNDTIVAANLTGSTATDITSVTIYGGRGDDGITANVTVPAKVNLAIYGSENAVENSAGDSITTSNLAGGSTVIYGGTAAADAADGKDVITVTGGGITTIYAAGGDDTVTLTGANSSADTTNSITVFGGGGNDSIALGTQTSANGTITITAGAGADTISLTSTAGAPSVGQGITITDFVTGAGGDKLVLTTGVTSAAVVTANGATAQTLQQALDLASANATAQQVGVVAFQGNTYVVIDNNTDATFQAGDVAIKLTGITDVAAVAAAITLA